MGKTRYNILIALLMIAGAAQAKNRNHQHATRHQPLTIGFHTQAGKILDVGKNRTLRATPSFSNGFIVRMPLITHFKAEYGLFYNSNLAGNIPTFSPARKSNSINNISLPVTVQYYMRPEHKGLKPYVGVGALLQRCCQTENYPLGDADIARKGTRYVSLLFNQGVIFEVNPHIELNESIHIVQEKDNTSVGFNVGIGFKLP